MYMKNFIQDFKFILRFLIKRPSYTLLTVLILALAIGPNTAIFSIINGFYLRPMPYPDDDRLVFVYNTYPKMGLDVAGTSIPDYLDRRERVRSLEALAIFHGRPFILGGDGPPERIQVTRASPSLFSVFQTAPALGRVFTEAEDEPGNDRVVVLSHQFWNTRFGAEPGIVGREIELNGSMYEVIGIMPERFVFPDRVMNAWVPFTITPEQAGDDQRGMEFSTSIGRLRPGATIETLNNEMDAIVRQNLESGREPRGEGFKNDTGFTGHSQLLRDMQVGDYREMLYILYGIVFAVLLIACANVANLQLARMSSRRKEMATRAALGAGGRRLAALALSESFVLAVTGAAVGLFFAWGGLELVRTLGIDHSTQGYEFVFDTSVMGFTFLMTLVVTLVSGIFPLFALKRINLAGAVHEAGRLGGGGRKSRGFRNALVVLQLAVSVALLAGAGLLTKSFYRMQAEGTGFDIYNVWTARFGLSGPRYENHDSWVQFNHAALERLRALPGVTEAGYTSSLPFSGSSPEANYAVEGYTPPPGSPPPHALRIIVSEGYLDTLGISITRGRDFSESESGLVAIVDENIARKYWPEGDAVGKRIREDAQMPDNPWFTIIGVVSPVKHHTLAGEPDRETIYTHYSQEPRPFGMLVLKTAMSPDLLTKPVRDAISGIDTQVSLANVLTMEQRVSDSLGPQRTPMVLTLVFALIAFVLAVAGIYGVLTWSVTQRTGEFGVRHALGANMNDIMRLVLKQGGLLILLGLVIGAAGAVGLGRLLSSQIYNVSPTDLSVLATVIAGLTVTAFIASWLPARRASRIDPMQALREE
jgi:predicted permease